MCRAGAAAATAAGKYSEPFPNWNIKIILRLFSTPFRIYEAAAPNKIIKNNGRCAASERTGKKGDCGE